MNSCTGNASFENPDPEPNLARFVGLGLSSPSSLVKGVMALRLRGVSGLYKNKPERKTRCDETRLSVTLLGPLAEW